MAGHEFGGDWTGQKLRVLDDYLTAYCKIFQTNPRAKHFETIYVDAFAGSGLIQQRARRDQEDDLFAEFAEPETIEFLSGSATRALQHPFDGYVFVEKSPAHLVKLEKLKAASPAKSRIAIRKGDANSRLTALIESTNWKKCRAVVFLDPYGMQVEWKTIESLGNTEAVDLWLLFPLGQAVMRLLRKGANPPAEWQRALDRIFGTHDWYGRFYISESESDLFEKEISSIKRIADWKQVSAFVTERLKTAFYAVAPAPGILWNSRNCPLYLLCFAAANAVGARPALNIANSLLKRLNY